MPPKPANKKSKGISPEEAARIKREAEERQALIELYQKEQAAEEFQRKENESRDREELLEKKRVKKEAQLRLLAEKDQAIVVLSSQLNALQSSFTSERAELEDELHRMLQLKDTLLNEISAFRSESELTQRRLLEERAALTSQSDEERRVISSLKAKLQDTETAAAESQDNLDRKIGKLQLDLEAVTNAKITVERDNLSKIKNLERDLEKVTSLNKTLQEVIESRESDDRKNVTLMQLLNNQLDENKRRSQEILNEEREKSKKLKQDLTLLETRATQLTEENEFHKREKDQIRKQADLDLQDYKGKVEQLKFDMKYLHGELHNYKTLLSKQQQESIAARSDATTETQNAKLALETQSKKVEELENLVRRKDKEHFDKVTFLNAQISNNRTIIAQLQQKLGKEREERMGEVSSVASELNSKVEVVHRLQDDIEKKKVASTEVEMKLNADIAILKSTVFQLQSALVDREKELEVVSAAKDEEIRRLRRKLDEHFIPHRNEIETTTGADEKALELVLNEKVTKLTRELEIKNRVALETETRLKAQLANQNHIIDSLQADTLRVKEELGEQNKILQTENNRLKQTLDIHFIPYRN